jgi:hypothetical protein
VIVRSRNIKPGFFKNEALSDLPFSTRLLFIGLWCLSDRRGLVEDRPRLIKRELFPDEVVDVETGLRELTDKELITRYFGASGIKCIKITKFSDHQRPHRDEPKNDKLDEPVDSTCKHGDSTTSHALNAECLLLNADCCLLNEECGMPLSPTVSSTESYALSPLLAAPVTIPVREGDEPIGQPEIDAWQSLYGNVRVLDELRAMSGYWGAVETTHRKTRKGIRRSIVTWLAKNHDRAHAGGPKSAAQFGIDGRAARTKAALATVLKEMNGGGNEGN